MTDTNRTRALTREPIEGYTPGQWRAVQRRFGYSEVAGGPERRLWDVRLIDSRLVGGVETEWASDKPNAKLMAAAPDLQADILTLQQLVREMAGLLRKGCLLVNILAESDEDDMFVFNARAFLASLPEGYGDE